MKTMERGVNLCNEQCNEQCLRMALFLFYNQRSTAFRLGCFQLNGLMLLFGVLMILQCHDAQEVIEVVFTLNLYSAKRSTMRNYFCELFSSVKNELMKTNKFHYCSSHLCFRLIALIWRTTKLSSVNLRTSLLKNLNLPKFL